MLRDLAGQGGFPVEGIPHRWNGVGSGF